MDPFELMKNMAHAAFRAEQERLDEQAQIFLKMGFTLEELVAVDRRIGFQTIDRGVYPKMIME